MGVEGDGVEFDLISASSQLNHERITMMLLVIILLVMRRSCPIKA